MSKVNIKFPKKNISNKEIESLFKKIGLQKLINKKKYFIDGYEVTKKDLIDKKKDTKDSFDIRITKNPQPPELRDLYKIYMLIVLNKRTTVLEFGCGFSSLVISKALEFNKSKSKKEKPFTRCEYPYNHFIIDDDKKYLNLTKKRIEKELKNSKTNYHFSECQMTMFNGNFAHEYKTLPRVNPDFIYLDGPSPFNVKGKINNFTVDSKDMMPMSCDILKFENHLTPGTIILIDGRTANARFLKNNFRRNWKEYYSYKEDQTIFLLNEKPLGPFNLEQLKFYSNKKK